MAKTGETELKALTVDDATLPVIDIGGCSPALIQTRRVWPLHWGLRRARPVPFLSPDTAFHGHRSTPPVQRQKSSTKSRATSK